MAAITAAVGGGNWTTGATWVGGVAPTAADDAFLTVASGNVTINSGAVARSLDCSTYVGTLTHSAGVSLALGDGTAGASNIALKLVSGMTYTKGNATTSAINFISTSGTQQTIDSGSKSLGNLTFNGAGSSYQLSAGLTIDSTALLTMTNGTLDTNNQTCSWGLFALGAGTKTLTLGSTTLTPTGSGTSWNVSTNSANFTLNSGTSDLIFNPTAAASPTPNFSNFTYYNVSCTKSAGGFTVTMANGATFNNFTQDNTVIGGGNRPLQITSGITININGVLTYIGNNDNVSRGYLQSGNNGSQTTIDLGTTGSVALTSIDLRDISFTGTAAPVSGTRLGDFNGNSGITFASPVTYYWIGNGGNMSDAAKYSTTSGGAAGSVIPLPHDTLVFDANSITSASQTIVNNMMRFTGIDFTNVTNNPIYNPRNPNGASNLINGSLILKSGMTVSATSASGGTIPHTFVGRGTHNLNFAGVDMLTSFIPTITAFDGTYTLQSDMTIASSRALNLNNGTFTANGYNLSVGLFGSSNSSVRTINMGTGNWSLTGTGTVWQLSTMTNLTFNSDTSTLKITDTSASTKTFAHGTSIIMYNLEITGGGTGAVIFGSNPTSWNDFYVTAGPKTLTFPIGAGSATTIRNNWNVTGSSGNLITIASATPGTLSYLSKSTGAVTSNYLSLQDSLAIGGATWYAGANSTNVSGNNGWQFSNQDVSKANFFNIG